MIRGLTLFILFFIVAGTVIYFTLPEDRPLLPRDQKLFFARSEKEKILIPPYYALRQDPQRRIARYLDRIKWGTNSMVRRTIDQLVADEDREFIGDLIQRIHFLRTKEPARAKRYIDLLAELEEPQTLSELITLCDDPSQMVRHAALRGVSRFESLDATECLLQHATGTIPETRRLALNLLSNRLDELTQSFFENVLANRESEAIPYALHAISKSKQASMISRIRPLLDDEDFGLRSSAMQVLLGLEDDEAFNRLLEKFDHPGPVVRKLAVDSLYFAGKLPDSVLLNRVARDEDGEVRIHLAAVLDKLSDTMSAEDVSKAREILDFMSRDPRAEIRLKAIEGLYRLGETDRIAPYMGRLRTATGGELREAVAITAHTLKIEEASPILAKRFSEDEELGLNDRMVLIEGMAELKSAEALPLLFRAIRGEWGGAIEEEGLFPLDLRTALIVHNLKGDVIGAWKKALEEDDSDRMAYLFINGASYLEDAGAVEPLLAIAADPDRPRRLREEALKAFAFLDEGHIGKRLLIYSETETDPDLSRLASHLFWGFY